MNEIEYEVERELLAETTVGELLRIADFGKAETAFIGTVGEGPKGELYIITVDGVFLAEDFHEFWTEAADATVDRFVDLVITAFPKK